MNQAMWIAASTMLSLACTAGCLPSTKVVKNPGLHDHGVRYYRPKPYLVIKPMIDKGGLPVAGYVTIDQTMMPDYSEEYSIHVRAGLGTNDTNITLSEGWNLTGLNVQLDAQFDENLEAVAEVIKAVPSLTSSESPALSGVAVRATNVPIGYYESVISKGCDGKKRLYGFRYVGFMPYAACPVESGGLEMLSCHDGQVYGLFFDHDGMVFKPLQPPPSLPYPDHVQHQHQHQHRVPLTTPPRYQGDDGRPASELNPAPEGLLDNDSPQTP